MVHSPCYPSGALYIDGEQFDQPSENQASSPNIIEVGTINAEASESLVSGIAASKKSFKSTWRRPYRRFCNVQYYLVCHFSPKTCFEVTDCISRRWRSRRERMLGSLLLISTSLQSTLLGTMTSHIPEVQIHTGRTSTVRTQNFDVHRGTCYRYMDLHVPRNGSFTYLSTLSPGPLALVLGESLQIRLFCLCAKVARRWLQRPVNAPRYDYYNHNRHVPAIHEGFIPVLQNRHVIPEMLVGRKITYRHVC